MNGVLSVLLDIFRQPSIIVAFDFVGGSCRAAQEGYRHYEGHHPNHGGIPGVGSRRFRRFWRT